MVYVFAAVSLLVILSFFLVFSHKKLKEKQLLKLRENWAKANSENIDLAKLDWYSPAQRPSDYHKLTSQTRSDIDFFQLFAHINHTTSKIGEQFLFHKLQHPSDDLEHLTELDRQAIFFSQNPLLREEVQLKLNRLGSRDAYSVSLLLKEELIEKPGWLRYLVFDILVLIACFILSVKFPIAFLFAILIVAYNVTYLNYWNKRHILSFSRSLVQLDVLIKVAQKLSKKNIPFDAGKIKGAVVFKKIQRKIRLLFVQTNPSGAADLSQIPIYLFEILKAIFLIDLFTIFGLIRSIEKNQQQVSMIFEYIGAIDVAISVASLRAGTDTWCNPSFTATENKFTIKNAIHPLVLECVPNSLEVSDKGILITGSNMSGKTTFLRALAINSILAQTIYTCYAEHYSAPLLRLFSSIRIDDSIFEGKSYYLQEVTVMKELIDNVQSGYRNIFLIDEIFKGTNTAERIASAKAILSYLKKSGSLVFVSTHDVELSGLLYDEFDLYHFTETILKDQMNFDHQLKKGPLTTRNAIKILAMSGYPEEITKEASGLAEKSTSKNPIDIIK
ncbi:MutS-related protein [Pedobacter sp. WC2501]|uniref:MutS-related protein n=1 Tax=Pedobacter sp. WC2501 TaxID=3461400 RepID=UPI0040454D33